MRTSSALLSSFLCTALMASPSAQAQQAPTQAPTIAVTIELESMETLVASLDLMGKGTGLPVSGQMLQQTMQASPMVGDFANIDLTKPVRLYVFLPAEDGARGAEPPFVMVIPVPADGAGFISTLKAAYYQSELAGKALSLMQPKGPGSPPQLFAEVAGSRVFVSSSVEALAVVRQRHATGMARNDLPVFPGVVRVGVDLEAIWPTVKDMFKGAAAKMPDAMPQGVAAPGMPKGMNPQKVLLAEIELLDAFIKDVKSCGIGLTPRAETLDFYSRLDIKPDTALSKTMAKVAGGGNRYAKVLPADAYFSMVSGGLQVWEDFIGPYGKFMDVLLAGSPQTGAESSKNMMSWMQSLLGQYAGDMGLAIVAKPGGGGLGLVQYFHLKNPVDFEKTLADMLSQMNDLYKDVIPGFSIEMKAKREYQGASITGISYKMAPADGEGVDPATAMMLSMMSKFGWEFAVVGEDMIYTMGGPQFTDLAVDRLKTPGGTSFMAAPPFATLIPAVKGTPVAAFSLSLVAMMKALVASMPNAQPEMLQAIPDGSGGLAGYSMLQNDSAAGVARLSYSEIKALVSSGQVLGGMVTQLMMGGMMQGMGAEPQAVPASTECRRNLMMIDSAKNQFGTFDEKLKEGGAVDPEGLNMYFPGGKMPICPDGGTYTIGAFGQDPTCSAPGHSLE